MYVITGVTGHTGKVAAETLLAKGEKVRVVVRSADKGAPWAARGADVAVGDLNDAAAMTAAFAGARGAYVLLPPDMAVVDYEGSRRAMIGAIAQAARAAKLPHVVLLSSVGAHLPSGTGPIAALHVAERELAAVTALTAVRAAYFIENFGAVLPAARDGVLPSFLPADLAFDAVATVDIGRTAAQALLDGPGGTRVIELAGPARITTNEAAATLARLLGRDVQVQVAPTSAVVPAFTSMGVGATMARLYQEMYEAMIGGRLGWEGRVPLTRGSTGLEPVFRGLLGR